MRNPLLLLDNDLSYIQALSDHLKRKNFDVLMARDATEALDLAMQTPPGIIIGDPDPADMDAVDFLEKMKSAHPDALLIVMADEHRLDRLMERIGVNAFDYLKKPVNSTALHLTLARAREWRERQAQLRMYSDKVDTLSKSIMLNHQLFDEIPCYLSVQNKQFRITAANSLFKRHFGDAVGDYCYKIYKHRDTPCNECPVAKTFEDGKSHSTEEVVTSKAGKQYNVLTWTAPIRDDNRNITHVIEMSTNITQIRELQNHLESLGMMLGSMSHGVKGMLTALDGGIYQIETGFKHKNEARLSRAIEATKDTSERIKRMVLDILYYAKSREVNAREMSVASFAETIIKTVKPLAKKQNVALIADIPDDLGTFSVDADWFQAAVINIIENSIDACAVSEGEAEPQVAFSVAASTDDTVCFTVRDNGMGMDKETKNKIFTLFFSSKGSKGTGLGLFISNHVIKEHGGTITVESEPGKGSIFTIQVPRMLPEISSGEDGYRIEKQ